MWTYLWSKKTVPKFLAQAKKRCTVADIDYRKSPKCSWRQSDSAKLNEQIVNTQLYIIQTYCIKTNLACNTCNLLHDLLVVKSVEMQASSQQAPRSHRLWHQQHFIEKHGYGLQHFQLSANPDLPLTSPYKEKPRKVMANNRHTHS